MTKHFDASKHRRLAGGHDQLRLAIEYVPLDEITAPARAVRDHSQRQRKQIGATLKHFGACIPAVIDRDNVIIVGAAVIDAAKGIGMIDFPVIPLDKRLSVTPSHRPKRAPKPSFHAPARVSGREPRSERRGLSRYLPR